MQIDTEKLFKEQQTLNDMLCAAISNQIETFQAKTGVSIKMIQIEMFDISSFGQELPKYIVGKVDTALAL